MLDSHETGKREPIAFGRCQVTAPGYPDRSQAAKLGLKPEQRVHLDDPPPGWALADPPAGLAAADPDGSADVIVAFFTAADQFAPRLPDLARRIITAPMSHRVGRRPLTAGIRDNWRN